MTTLTGKYKGTKEYHLVYSELISAARYRGMTTYQAVAQIMGLPLSGQHMANQVGQMLGTIAQEETEQGRPILTALVVSSVSGQPGPGFYDVSKKLGRLHDDSPEAHQQFWQAEKEAVYAAWRREFKA